MKEQHPFENDNTQYRDPEPLYASKQRVHEFAENVATELGYKPGNEQKKDLKKCIQKLGGRLHYLGGLVWEQTDSGSIIVHGETDFDICISNFTGPLRNRFTIAHELGHYFLHSRQGEIPLKAQRFGSNQAEWEANWFAAGFLMPEKPFSKDYNKGFRIYNLAIKYGVSESAAEVRLKSLNLI